MILLISYDLNGHERPEAYEQVSHMIKAKATSFRKPLYSQWLVDTSDSIQNWHERMKEITDNNDYWLITQLTSKRQGWLPKDVWDWIDART